MLSPLLVLVGGHVVSGQDHPPGVIADTFDFHGDFYKPITWGKLIQKYERQNSPMLLLILLFFFSIWFTFFYYYSHRISSLCCFFSPPTEKNCHLEHLFLWLADNSTCTSKPSQISPCILFSTHLIGTYLTPSNPSPVQRWAIFIWPSHWTLPPASHSIPPLPTQVNLLNKHPGYHPHPTFTLRCCALIISNLN